MSDKALRAVAVLFGALSLMDLYMVLLTPFGLFTLFYAVFSLYFAYRAKQLWEASK